MTGRPQLERVALAGRRILVTGGSGFIGMHVVRDLFQAGAAVLSVDVSPPRRPHPYPCRTEICDIRSPGLIGVVAAFAPQVIVHLAAQVDVADSERAPAIDADVNVCGTIAVAEAAAVSNARLVFTASCAVFGDSRRLPIGEDHPLAPTTPYGLSKAAALGYVEWFAGRRGLEATSLILGNVYGPTSQRGVVREFIACAMSEQPAMLHGHGRNTRDFVHVDDVADAVLRACIGPATGRVNIGSGAETSISQLHGLVGEITDREIPPVLVAAPTGAIERICLRVSLADRMLGWSPKITLRDGIAAFASVQHARGIGPLFGGRRDSVGPRVQHELHDRT